MKNEKIEADTYQSQITWSKSCGSVHFPRIDQIIFREEIFFETFPLSPSPSQLIDFSRFSLNEINKMEATNASATSPFHRHRNSVKDSFSFGDFNYNPPNFQELKGISFTLGKLNSFRDSPRYFNELAEFLWKRKYIVSSNYCSCRCFVDLNVRINIFFFFLFFV